MKPEDFVILPEVVFLANPCLRWREHDDYIKGLDLWKELHGRYPRLSDLEEFCLDPTKGAMDWGKPGNTYWISKVDLCYIFARWLILLRGHRRWLDEYNDAYPNGDDYQRLASFYFLLVAEIGYKSIDDAYQQMVKAYVLREV